MFLINELGSFELYTINLVDFILFSGMLICRPKQAGRKGL